MKKYDYTISSILLKISAVVFFSQLFLEVGGIIERKSGFEWVVPLTGGLFLGAVLYFLTLFILNHLDARKVND